LGFPWKFSQHKRGSLWGSLIGDRCIQHLRAFPSTFQPFFFLNIGNKITFCFPLKNISQQLSNTFSYNIKILFLIFFFCFFIHLFSSLSSCLRLLALSSSPAWWPWRVLQRFGFWGLGMLDRDLWFFDLNCWCESKRKMSFCQPEQSIDLNC